MVPARAADGPAMRILVAGVGNLLRGDDGFGIEVARRLAERDLPDGVTVVETGIAGIALVHELQAGWDAVVVVDTVDRDRPPGTVMMIVPEVLDVETLSPNARADILADMHLATPERALMLARALGVLPDNLMMIGCQPEDMEEMCQGLSEPVARALDPAVEAIVDHVRALGVGWASAGAGRAGGSDGG